MNIEDLDLSVRSYNCLKRAGIDTVEQLRQMDDEQLSRVRNLGAHCAQEIRGKVESKFRVLESSAAGWISTADRLPEERGSVRDRAGNVYAGIGH